jgi:disulfide oxidoreductase YuzD
MSSEILVAIIGFIGTAFGSCMGAVSTVRLTNYRLEQLERKFDNCPIKTERLALLEQRSEEHEKRITKLETKVEKD